MEKKRKQWRLSELDWKSEVIVFLLLMASAFFINRGIKIKGLFMDDLYMWSCYGEQTFREFVFPVGGTRCRFVFYLAAYLQMALIGIKLNWFVPCNIIINGLISYTVYRFGMRLSKNGIFMRIFLSAFPDGLLSDRPGLWFDGNAGTVVCHRRFVWCIPIFDGKRNAGAFFLAGQWTVFRRLFCT